MKTNSSHNLHLLASVFMLFLFAPLSWAQTVRYVKANATGANNGSSWNDAYVSLQSALAAAQPNDQIWVAAGTYKPTTGTDRTISFSMKNNVAIYGGFPNVGSPSMADRNWQTNVTILSGDLSGNDQVEGSGISLRINNAGENSYQVIANRFTAENPLSSTAVLDGFTVTGGTNQESLFGPYNSGAGMFNLYASPTVRNTKFYGNYGYRGGGMMNSLNCSPVVTNVVFDRNLAFADGGGMYNFDGANVVLTNVVFTGNLGYGSFGGGGTFNGNNNPSFTNCHFEGNGASVGAGMVGIGMTANFKNCTAANNRSFQDGGFTWIENSSVSFTNCLFSGNRAGSYAGVIRNRNSTLNIVNCTFFDNRAGVNSGQGNVVISTGVMAIDGTNPVTNIANSIIWGNQTLFGGSGNPSISYSIIQGGWNGSGNSSNDPLFLNSSMPAGTDNTFGTSDDGLTLQRCSPAINAGSNGLIPSGITTDLLQNARRFNNGAVDLGPYEFQTESFNIQVSSNSPVCIGTSLELNVTGGNTYTWAGPNNFNSTEQGPILPGATTNTSGGYSITVSDGTCTVTTSTFVQVNNPTVEATSVSPACSGGVLSLSASNGGHSYTWSGPNGYSSILQNPTRSDVSLTMSGLYSVTLSDGKCSATASTSVQVYASPSVVASNNGVVCSGNPLNLSATGNGNAYTWSGPNGFSSLSQSPVRTPSSVDMSGGYTVTAFDGTCTATASTLVEVRSLPTLEVSSNSPLCAGSALNLSANGSGNAYSWSGPNNFNSTEQSPIRSSANTSMSGQYSVTVSDGTCIATELTSVLVNTPSIRLTSNSPVCLGNTLNLSASGTGVAYTWSGPNTYSSLLQNPTRSDASLAMSGQYIVTVSDGTCTATASILVQINNNPVVTAGHYTPVCSGSTLSLTASGAGSSYTWSGPNGFSSVSQNPVRNTSSIDMSGDYTVTLGDGTCTATASTSVEVKASPTATVTSNSPLCVGSTLSLNVTTGSNNYSWTGPNGFTSGQSNPIRYDANTSMSGRYSVMVSDGTCTTTVSTSVLVSDPIATASANSPVCAGSALNLSATGGSSYTWTGPGGFTSNQQNPRRTGANAAMAGTYSLSIRNATGCTATASMAVIVSPNVAPSITSLQVNNLSPNAQNNTVAICNNAAVSLNITATNAVTYSWRGPTGAGSGFTSSLVSPVNMPIASPRQGQYTVTVRNGCTVFNQRVINIQLINCNNTRLASAEDTEGIEMEINAYPNPVSKTLTVEVRLKEAQPLQLKLLNSVGQTSGTWQLSESSTTHRTELDLSKFTDGVYLLEAQAGQQRAVKRVVKIQYE